MPKRSPSPFSQAQQSPKKCPRPSQISTANPSDTTRTSPNIFTLPPESRQKILLSCYDERHERIAKHFATCSQRLRVETYDSLYDGLVKTAWSFRIWLNSVKTAAPQLMDDIEHVRKVVRTRQERVGGLLEERRFEQEIWFLSP